MTAGHAVRWALVPVACLALWYGLLLAGIAAIGVLDALCPPEQMVSGACTAAWHAPAVDGLVLVFAAVLGAGLVVLPARVAPSHRLPVAGAAFAGGALLATWLAWDGGLWGPYAAAGVAGAAALARAVGRARNAHPSGRAAEA